MYSWDIPMYTSASVGRLVGLRTGRITRWLRGYDYRYLVGSKKEQRIGHKGPVISRSSDDARYATFLDLIDLLFVKKFLEQGLTLQKIRKALLEAEELLGGHHFAQRDFFTDGSNIYLQVKKDADALMELLSGGQWVISSIIKELSHQIDFHETTGFAQRWFPLGPKGLVVLDPAVSFGQPAITGKGISTLNIYDFFIGEQENLEKVCSWMNLFPEEVKAAVFFEQSLIAA